MFSLLKNRIKEKIKLRNHEKMMINYMNGKEGKEKHLLFLIIKQVHSIEKGLLNVDNFKFDFGMQRIKLMFNYISLYLENGGDFSCEELCMAKAVCDRYIQMHKEKNYNSDWIQELRQLLQKYLFNTPMNTVYGGIKKITSSKFDIEYIKKFFSTRHSVRDFKDEPIKEEVLMSAIELAMTAPSACNRQTTRVYVVDKKDFSIFSIWKGGVTSFLNKVDKILIITGSMSGYEKDEYYQYAVSGSIFAGYLLLTLHAYGIDSCILQRQLLHDSNWGKIKKTIGIPEDEQSVCAIACGIQKDEKLVAISYRKNIKQIVKFYNNNL